MPPRDLPRFERLPAYVRKVKLASGKTAYYFELPHWAKPPAKKHGRECPVQSEALGTDLAHAISKGANLNEALAEWRKGDAGAGLVKGTVAWLFNWYREQDRFTKNKAKTRADYKKLMDMLVSLETKKGKRYGTYMARTIDATVADGLYKRLRESGERQATYAMQVCRLVWTWAVRHKGHTGVSENPFAGMGLKSTAARGNRETSRAEYNLYRETARKLGYQSMATAAALAFECCQRVWDVFGFEDADGVEHRGIPWAGYRPGEEITLIQSKTGNLVALPLFEMMPGDDGKPERVLLYPELEEELARAFAVREGEPETIVREERNGRKYKERRMSTVHREICTEAGLPKEMTFTGFRHGGITEIGDAGEDDVRAVSGHKTLAVTKIYNKANAEKARRIASTRRAHIERIGALDEQKDQPA